MPSSDPSAFLDRVVGETRDRFVDKKLILGFREYLDVVAQEPTAQTRDAARYLRDVFDHYGTTEIKRPYGRYTRFNLFDCPFDEGRDALVGQEAVQQTVYGLLTDFVRQGRVSKLILLHGPNGSAKSSFISCMMRALEDYSNTAEGAQYTFSWVFPMQTSTRGNIGFSSTSELADLDTYAYLTDAEVSARLRTETRDHPLLLLPKDQRVEFLEAQLGPDAQLPDSLSQGELSPKARQIYDALLRAYQGDVGEVLKHVQVERFFVSRRYRQAAVTVDPQMRSDAAVRQVTADRSLSALPPSLQNVTLYEPMGDLVEANRGIIEFNDLLKRPLEAFKYLLSTCEHGIVRLDTMTLYLDTVFVGSCNANRLSAFKEMPDFASFKARIELIRVPYLADVEQERRIYAEQVDSARVGRPVAPHTDEVAAMWAILTRLERPQSDRYPTPLRKHLSQTTPLQKARMYAYGEAPGGAPRKIANGLVSVIPDLFNEQRGDLYEGRFGASPREIRTALMAAARRSDQDCLTPLSVISELRVLCQERSTYEFLRIKPDGEYHRAELFLDAVEAWYLAKVEEELHDAMGLVDPQATVDLFKRYIDHVIHAMRGEKRINPMSGATEEPDDRLMRRVEARLGVDDSTDDFRKGVIPRIAAWRMDNPDDPLDFTVIFADRLATLNEAFYEEKREVAERIKRDLLTYMVDGEDALDPKDRARAESTLQHLEQVHGYTKICAIQVISHLLKGSDAS